ncbi:CpaB family protein [Cellulomonas alba]|uniref:SAF domain-containing protein n=1 Tax=Cellulomonas alba TaxID=3053467 RepID=A0ABT7SCQ9_9CELL|nr:hypothetical protein [Cellulomonas alba]MDM7853978.1 hypothetical protein [Cellulomonas alba]
MQTAVLELPAPAANRLRRPSWRDPRLLAGIAMVAAAVALGSWIVRSAQHEVPVYAARHALVAGEQLHADDLVVVGVRGIALDRYLAARGAVATDLVALRTVGAGELVPRAAVGDGSSVDVRSVAVPLQAPPGRDLQVGAVVDLWFTPRPDADRAAGAPGARPIAQKVVVSEASSGDGAFTTGSGATVHVLVPTAQLADVLEALAADGTVDVVPLPGGVPGSEG